MTPSCRHPRCEKSCDITVYPKTAKFQTNRGFNGPFVKISRHQSEIAVQLSFSVKMSCQVYGCSVRQGYGKSLHRFPDPTKKKELYQAWLCNLNLTSNSFIFSKHKLVCEDHFEKSCFETDLMVIILF